ncbi:hypothetical protein BH10PSE14_BH10PSE14_42110 [soil metagenome]
MRKMIDTIFFVGVIVIFLAIAIGARGLGIDLPQALIIALLTAIFLLLSRISMLMSAAIDEL